METLYTVEDLARLTSATTRTIRNYLRDGQLKGRKLGGQWRFTQRDLDRFLQIGAEAAGRCQRLCKLINDSERESCLRFRFDYGKAEDKARFVLFASPALLAQALKTLEP